MSDTPRIADCRNENYNVVQLKYARQLERELTESQARATELRAALESLFAKVMDCGYLGHQWTGLSLTDKCRAALTLPTPPVVAMADARALVAVLENVPCRYQQSSETCPGCRSKEAVEAFNKKYPTE